MAIPHIPAHFAAQDPTFLFVNKYTQRLVVSLRCVFTLQQCLNGSSNSRSGSAWSRSSGTWSRSSSSAGSSSGSGAMSSLRAGSNDLEQRHGLSEGEVGVVGVVVFASSDLVGGGSIIVLAAGREFGGMSGLGLVVRS